MRTRAVLTLAVFSLVLFVNRAARADSFSWIVPANGQTSGGNVAGIVTITTTSGGFDISIVNLEDNPSNIAQVITGLDLSLTSAGKTAGLQSAGVQSQDGYLRTICTSNGGGCSPGEQVGQYTQTPYGNMGPPASSGWQTNSGTNYFKGDLAICAGGCGTWSPDGIIGDPDPGTGRYDNLPDPSLSSGIHPPEAWGSMTQPVTFHMYAAGVTANSTVTSLISGAQLVFGTGGETVGLIPGQIPPPPMNTPEPATLLLVAPGVYAIMRRLRRR